MSLTKLSLGGNNVYMYEVIIPAQLESLVSDIPPGGRNIEKLFYGVDMCYKSQKPNWITYLDDWFSGREREGEGPRHGPHHSSVPTDYQPNQRLCG